MPPKPKVSRLKKETVESAACENEESEPVCEYEVIPDGDIIFVAGPEQKRVRLSSHLLCTTSKVFKTMIHSDFKEGEAFRQSDGGFTEIQLPHDDAATIFYAFRALYCPDPASRPTPKQIQQVAIFADKYDMAGHFVFAASFWMQQPVAEKYSLEECWQLFTASYWLRHPLGFYNFSKILVDKKPTPLVKFALAMSDKTLGFRLCLAIESVRCAILHKNRRKEGGVCFSCFNTATEGFEQKGPNGETPHYHISF